MRSNRVFNLVRSTLLRNRPQPDDGGIGEPAGEAASVAAADAEAAAARARHESSLKATFANGPLPSNFSINLGAAPCNHSCRFCPQSVHKPKRASWLDLDLLRKVAGEMPEEGMTVSISS
jgi:hypothetical protein